MNKGTVGSVRSCATEMNAPRRNAGMTTKKSSLVKQVMMALVMVPLAKPVLDMPSLTEARIQGFFSAILTTSLAGRDPIVFQGSVPNSAIQVELQVHGQMIGRGGEMIVRVFG